MKSLIHIFLIAGISLCHAQKNSDSQPPEKPVAIRAPAFASWSVTYTYKDGDKGDALNPQPLKDTKIAKMLETNPLAGLALSPPRIKMVSCMKTNNVIHVLTVCARGYQEDRWMLGPFQFVKLSSAPRVLPTSGDSGPLRTLNFSQTDFIDFQWVDRNNFIGEKVEGTRKAWVFKKSGSLDQLPFHALSPSPNAPSISSHKDSANPQSPSAEGTITAEIDELSKLPILLQSEDETRTFQFGTPPGEVMQLPPDFQQAVDQANAQTTYSRRALPRTIANSSATQSR